MNADIGPRGPCEGRLPTVRVERNRRGGWTVEIPEPRNTLSCDTLDDARRAAHLSVPEGRPCELIVRDAYHRVLGHELLNAQRDD